LVVGLVISVKIGGGGNLHNLDMLWIALVICAAWAARSILAQPPAGGLGRVPAALIALALVGPVAYGLTTGAPLTLPDPKVTQTTMAGVQQAVDQSRTKPGEVLFLDQRQLLTFDLIPGVMLVPDYEKKYLMDQAMANNAPYFQKMYADLARQRFQLIVSEPLQVFIQDSEHGFSDENNAWTKWVSAPILCYYEPLETYAKSAVQLLVPRANPENCTLPVQ
jgi:hypothetical protein